MKDFKQLMIDVINAIPSYELTNPKTLRDAGFPSHTILRIDREEAMKMAVRLRRNKVCDDRAEALEHAFDYLLRKKVGTKWSRVGEVNLNREGVRALCVDTEEVTSNV